MLVRIHIGHRHGLQLHMSTWPHVHMSTCPHGDMGCVVPCSGKLKVSKPTWWLESRFHFSFADYYNPENTNFGALRVCSQS